MKSILFLSIMNGDAWGGSEVQWYQLANWMLDRKYRIGVAVFDWEEKKEKLDVLRSKGCEVYLIPGKGSGIIKKLRQQKVLNNIPFKSYEFVYLNQGGWKDVAHGPFKRLYKKFSAYAISFHNYQLNSNLESSKVNILNEWIQHASVCIAATGIIYKMLEGEYRISIKNKEVSYSPPTFPVSSQLPAYKENSPEETAVFLLLGALDTVRKAQDLMIEVLSGNNWKNRNWRLLIYGEGKDRKMLEELISQKGLIDKVIMKGFTNNPQACLENCHVLLQVSHFDAMPISVIEAMAMGRPCVVSNVGDMPQWVVPGYNGFIAQDNSIAAVSKIMEQLWDARENWKTMGEHAHKTFNKKMQLPFEEKFLELLNSYNITN